AESERGDGRAEAGAQQIAIQQLVTECTGVWRYALAHARTRIHVPGVADSNDLACAEKPWIGLCQRHCHLLAVPGAVVAGQFWHCLDKIGKKLWPAAWNPAR